MVTSMTRSNRCTNTAPAARRCTRRPAPSPPHDATAVWAAGSPESKDSDEGRAVTVAQTGPIDAVTLTVRHESPPARKSIGTRTYAQSFTGSSCWNTGSGVGSVRVRSRSRSCGSRSTGSMSGTSNASTVGRTYGSTTDT